MLSALAQQFAANRTTANFNALAAAEPQLAAQYLARAADAAGIDAPWKVELDRLLGTGFDPAALQTFFSQNQPAVQALELAAVQAARIDTLGFSTHTPEPTPLVGVVGVAPDSAAPTLTLGDGTVYRLEMPNWPDRGSQGNQMVYFEVNALQSFAGRTATIRAYPTATPGTLAVEEFSPSSNPKFVSGRVSVLPDGRVGLNVRPDKWVEIRSAELAAGLKVLGKTRTAGEIWAGTGVILQDAVAKRDAQGWYVDSARPDYWMLGRSNGTGSLLAGHGQAFPVQGATPWPENAAVRLLVYGHANGDRSIVQHGFFQTPQVRIDNGINPTREANAMLKLAQVDVSPPANGVDRFEP